MPKLSKIDLSQNRITTIRSLNHLVMPITVLKLCKICINQDDNPILDVFQLTRSSFLQL